jgi:hypothetical protein
MFTSTSLPPSGPWRPFPTTHYMVTNVLYKVSRLSEDLGKKSRDVSSDLTEQPATAKSHSITRIR